MTFLLATIVFPALVVALALGTGLLVDRAAGGRVPGVLLVPVGLAGLVVVAELFAWQEPLGSLAPAALVVCAVAGYALGLPRLRGARVDAWPALAAVAAYVAVCAPVLLFGDVTMAGYLLDTTVGFHLLGSDYLLEHGRNFSELPVSTYRMTLEAYYGTQYPSGGHTLLGAAGRLVGVDRIWLYQPFLSVLLACCVPVLYSIARAAALPRPVAAAAATLAAIPALVYSYAQMGAIKEVTALPFVLLLGALLVLLPRLVAAGLRSAVVAAVVAAAGVGAIGLAFVPWLAVAGVAGLALLASGIREHRLAWKPLVGWIGVLALALVLLALPTFGPLSESLTLAESFSTSNQGAVNDPGNLLRPLKLEQTLGVWLTGGHLGDPVEWFQETYVLIGIALLAALLGLVWLVRRRQWPVVAWVAASLVVWAVLTRRGTAWTDAKLLVITSPVPVLLAAFGVESLRRSGRRLEAVAVGALLAVGILASNAFTYHDTNLLPGERYEELLEVGERYPSAQAALLPEFDELALYALQDLPPDGPGFAYKNPQLGLLRDGTPPSYGRSYDLDQITPQAVATYPTIVMRRRPDASRPPAAFRRVFRGRFYDVWRKTGDMEVVDHLPAGAGLQAAGRVSCRELRLAVSRAAAGASVAYVPRPRLRAVDPIRAERSPGWAETAGGVGLYTPGTLEAGFELPLGGRYRIWLKGEFGREVRVYVDGRRVGAISYESGNDGNYGTPLETTLVPGRHRLRIERGGGSLRPGDRMPGALRAIMFEPATVDPEPRVVPASEWRQACESLVDWVEVHRPA